MRVFVNIETLEILKYICADRQLNRNLIPLYN